MDKMGGLIITSLKDGRFCPSGYRTYLAVGSHYEEHEKKVKNKDDVILLVIQNSVFFYLCSANIFIVRSKDCHHV